MEGPVWDVRMPWQMYNTLSILVAALLLLWVTHALRRARKMWNLRAAVLSSRLVQVRGLGSYLEYFAGATPAHVDHMVHTRQVEPPTQVRSLYIPFSLQSVKVERLGKQNALQFELDFSCDVPCRVVVLTHFRTDVFKQKAANSFEGPSMDSERDANSSGFFAVHDKLGGGGGGGGGDGLWW